MLLWIRSRQRDMFHDYVHFALNCCSPCTARRNLWRRHFHYIPECNVDCLCTVWMWAILPTFRTQILPLSAGSKRRPNKQYEASRDSLTWETWLRYGPEK
jgi:hypothetical protein